MEISKKLREAVRDNDIISLKQILSTPNFDLNTRIDYNGLTVLHLCVQLNNFILVKYIFDLYHEKNMRLDVTDNKLGRTPLHYSCTKGIDINIIKLLLCGSDVNFKTVGGETPLMKAIFFNNLEALRLLLRYGADTQIFNKSNENALMIASREGKKNAVAYIDEYYSIFIKLCMILKSYHISVNDPERETPFTKFSPQMIKNLTNYIIL